MAKYVSNNSLGSASTIGGNFTIGTGGFSITSGSLSVTGLSNYHRSLEFKHRCTLLLKVELLTILQAHLLVQMQHLQQQGPIKTFQVPVLIFLVEQCF
jgi:hypothetical protein